MAAPVHILTHEFTPFRGGIAVYVEELARALSKLGMKTKVWAPSYREGVEDTFLFAVQRIRMRGKQDWICRWKMARALKRAFPGDSIPGTVILAEPGPIRLWMYHRWLGLPRPDRLVLVLHGTELRQLSGNERRRKRLGRLISDSDCIGIVSNSVRQEFLEHYPEAASKIVMVPGAVRSSWAETGPEVISKDRGIREILQVGRIDPRKGQMTLVKAIELLPADLVESIRVRMIGSIGRKAYAQSIQERIHSSGLPISMEGAVQDEELRSAYEAATLVVMPSQAFNASIEGLGLALIEAQHFGRPVIGSRIGGIPQALAENESGLLVTPGDPSELSAAIASILTDSAKARKMGDAGPRFVRHHFSWEKNARKLSGMTA